MTSAKNDPLSSRDSGRGDSAQLDGDVTAGLVMLNLAVFILERQLSKTGLHAFQIRYQLSLEGIQAGHWWQLLSYQFLHGGWWHMVFNLLFLHSLGPVLETTLGRWRYLALYLGAGVMGGLLHLAGAVLSPQNFSSPVVGASAGLSGLLAALGSIYAETRLPLLLFFIIPLRVKAKWVLLGFALLTVVGTLVPIGRVAHLAHLGGLLGGLLGVNLMRTEPLDLLGSDGQAISNDGSPTTKG